MYSRFIGWFNALPNASRLGLLLGVLLALPIAGGILVLLSPLVTLLALIVLLVSVFKLVAQARAHGPLRGWGITVGGSLLVLLIFAPISNALYGNDAPEEQAATSEAAIEEPEPTGEKTSREDTEAQTKKEAAQEERTTRKSKDTAVRSQAQEKAGQRKAEGRATQSRPQSLEERIRAVVSKDAVRQEAFKISVEDDGTGCKYVTVDHREAENWAANPSFVELNMRKVYEAIYSDRQLSGSVCSVTVNAMGDLIDKYGNRNSEMIYSTTIDRATANKINWQNSYSVDFPNVWKTNYKHPAVDQAETREQLEKAIDCLKDEGLFDIDIGC